MLSHVFLSALLAGFALANDDLNPSKLDASRDFKKRVNTISKSNKDTEKIKSGVEDLAALHALALATEGGHVTCWHGGDEAGQQDRLKQAFEETFQGMKLNMTVDLSKYHEARIDQQLAAGPEGTYVDSIILQTLHNYPRWAKEGALMHYEPHTFPRIPEEYKDKEARYYGIYINTWFDGINVDKTKRSMPTADWDDWLLPHYKDKLVLTYPNDDDAILFGYHLILEQKGTQWFERLVKQNPYWVRGAQTPSLIAGDPNYPQTAFFSAGGTFQNTSVIDFSNVYHGKYVSWPQTAAILKHAPHPIGARLLHNFLLSDEWQVASLKYPIRPEIRIPEGARPLVGNNATDPTQFLNFMKNREYVERLRLYIEGFIGPPQGLSPVDDFITN